MSIWDALDEGHGAAPFSTEPSAYEQHLAAERRQLTPAANLVLPERGCC